MSPHKSSTCTNRLSKADNHKVLSSYKTAVPAVQGFCTASTKALYRLYKAPVPPNDSSLIRDRPSKNSKNLPKNWEKLMHRGQKHAPDSGESFPKFAEYD